MADANQTTVTVEYNGETFVFKIPQMRDEARMSAYIQSLIVQDTGSNSIKESMLDEMAQLSYRTLALFALQLEKSSALWPYKENELTKAPEINLDAIPQEAGNIYVKYIDELNKFLLGRNSTGQAAGNATVAGGENPGG